MDINLDLYDLKSHYSVCSLVSDYMKTEEFKELQTRYMFLGKEPVDSVYKIELDIKKRRSTGIYAIEFITLKHLPVSSFNSLKTNLSGANFLININVMASFFTKNKDFNSKVLLGSTPYQITLVNLKSNVKILDLTPFSRNNSCYIVVASGIELKDMLIKMYKFISIGDGEKGRRYKYLDDIFSIPYSMETKRDKHFLSYFPLSHQYKNCLFSIQAPFKINSSLKYLLGSTNNKFSVPSVYMEYKYLSLFLDNRNIFENYESLNVEVEVKLKPACYLDTLESLIESSIRLTKKYDLSNICVKISYSYQDEYSDSHCAEKVEKLVRMNVYKNIFVVSE